MSLIGALPRPEIVDKVGKLLSPWMAWFSLAQGILQAQGQTGTTAARPVNGLYVGYQYFDTTLGYPVWVKTVSPAVWVRYDGTTV